MFRDHRTPNRKRHRFYNKEKNRKNPSLQKPTSKHDKSLQRIQSRLQRKIQHEK